MTCFARALFLTALSAAFCATALSAAPVLIAQDDFSRIAPPECVMKDVETTETTAEFRDGWLLFRLGDGLSRSPVRAGRTVWHGKKLQRRVDLYGDFTVECSVKWQIEGKDTIAALYVGPQVAGAGVPAAEIMFQVGYDAYVRALHGNIDLDCKKTLDNQPPAGQAALRIERQGKTMRISWDGKPLAEGTVDAALPIDAVVITAQSFGPGRGTVFAVSNLKAWVPAPRIKLRDAATPAPVAGKREAPAVRAREMRAALDAFLARRYKLESALDVLRFDLDDLRGRPEHAALSARVGEFAAFMTRLEALNKMADEAAAKEAEAMQFYAQADPAEIADARTRAAESAARFSALEKEIAAMETPLRAQLAALRPAKAAPDYADNFKWLQGRHHLYWFNHYGNVPPGVEDSIRYMGAMGATLLQERPPRDKKWEEYVQRIRGEMDLLQRQGMKLFMTTGGTGLHPHPDSRKALRAFMDQYVKAFGDHPAFAGFEFDEDHFGECWCQICMPIFRQYLKDRFTREQMIGLGIIKDQVNELDALGPPAADERTANPPLYITRQEWKSHIFLESATEAFAYGHSLKKDAIMFPLYSPAQVLGSPFDTAMPKMAALGDMIALDPYWNGVPDEALYCDLMRANAKGPAILTVGTPYKGRTLDSLRRDLAIGFAHADGIYVFDWAFAFKQPPYLNPPWRGQWLPEGKWDDIWAMAQKVRKIEKYLVNARSPARVAMLYSERSAAFDHLKAQPMILDAGEYAINQMGLYNLYRQAGIQQDPLYVEGLTRERLARYNVLVVQDARSLTEEQESLLRAWVRDGGRLIATASTTLLDPWGRRQANYRLADVFGVAWLKSDSAKDAHFGADPAVTYSGPFDRVQPTTGKVLAAFADGTPAVVGNSFGKGACTFLAIQAPGLAYTSTRRGGEPRPYFNVHKTFSPGVRELMAKLTVTALEEAGGTLPFRVSGLPEAAEIVMRVQDLGGGAGRRVLHLLNYGFEVPVHNVTVAVPVSRGRGLAAFYPADDQPLQLVEKDGWAQFTVRDFAVHEAIVIEDR